jgi:hypothetical protein
MKNDIRAESSVSGNRRNGVGEELNPLKVKSPIAFCRMMRMGNNTKEFTGENQSYGSGVGQNLS